MSAAPGWASIILICGFLLGVVSLLYKALFMLSSSEKASNTDSVCLTETLNASSCFVATVLVDLAFSLVYISIHLTKALTSVEILDVFYICHIYYDVENNSETSCGLSHTDSNNYPFTWLAFCGLLTKD